jgi:hypothetical protein
MNLSVDRFAIRFRVRFDDFNNNYPMLVRSATNALQCHGLGPAYGSDQGRICLYIGTVSHIGPHGRGINGTPGGASENGGWVRSVPLTIGVWHKVCLKKTLRSLSIFVDGEESCCELDDSFATEDFYMKEPGEIYVAGDSRLANDEVCLHGELGDFSIANGVETVGRREPVRATVEVVSTMTATTISEDNRRRQQVSAVTTNTTIPIAVPTATTDTAVNSNPSLGLFLNKNISK